jgi:hypothetical protein
MAMDETPTQPAESHRRHHPWRRLSRPIQHFLFDDPGFLPTPPAQGPGPSR